MSSAGPVVDPEVAAPITTSNKRTNNKSNNNNSRKKKEQSSEDRFKSIASKTSVLIRPQVTLTCYVPSQCVGVVIGRRGSTILQIQKYAQQYSSNQNNTPNNSSSQVRVSIVSQQETDVPYTYSELDWSSPNWTPVVIRADPSAALAAASKLDSILAAELKEEPPYMDDVVLDLPLSRAKHAALVGKKGLVLQNLSADTRVRIMVPRKDLRHDVVQLEGALGDVERCLEQMLTLISNADAKKKRQAPSSESPQQQPPSEQSQVLTVSALPSQTKLRNIARKTDTVITKKRTEEDTWELTVSGLQVAAAVALLEKHPQEEETDNNNNNKSPKPRTRRGPRVRNRNAAKMTAVAPTTPPAAAAPSSGAAS